MSNLKKQIRSWLKQHDLHLYRAARGGFVTFHERPKQADEITVLQPDYCQEERVAIVVQGGIHHPDAFTLETLKLYQKLYPAATLILSTWDTEKPEILEAARQLGAEVVVNPFPEKMVGHGSNNLQLISSHNGIKRAQELGAAYVMKSRTDQRIYGEGNISYLLNLLKRFPLQVDCSAAARIVVCSNGCFQNRLYNVSDMLLFGRTEDLLRYFSCPMDTRPERDVIQGDDLEAYSKKRPGEIYFASHYLESLGFELQWTREDSDRFFRDLFIIADCSSMDWYWPKYSDAEYRWLRYNDAILQPITHRDWLNMQTK